MSVFVIINEWTDIEGHTSSSIAEANYYESEESARRLLKAIAEVHDIELEEDATSVQLGDHLPHLMFEEYYIQELEKM